MPKILASIIFLSVVTFASPAQDFLADINATYSNAFYEKLDIDKNKNITLANADNNSTQKKIKEDFERLLPKYLKVDDLFPESGSYADPKTIKKYLPIQFKDFFEISILYLNLLSHKQEQGLHDKLLKKNLLSLHAFIHKKGMISYLFSLILYQRLYAHLECHTKEDYLLLQKYPPPDKSFFFIKFEEEKQRILHLDPDLSSLKKAYKKIGKEDYQKVVNQTEIATKKYVKANFADMISILKLESLEKYEKYNEKIKKNMDKDLESLSTKIKIVLCLLKIELFAKWHIEQDYDCVADFAGKRLGWVAMPRTGFIYFEHIDILQDYNKKLKKCAQDNPTK